MIYLSEISSPLGHLAVAECRERILSIAFGGVRGMEAKVPGLWKLGEVSRAESGPAAERLADYLRGAKARGRFSVDLSLVTGDFDRAVLKRLFRTKPGETFSYGELAAEAGSPRSARAVGGAMRRNPIPIVIPCHRVLPKGGGLGNYTGGVDKKEWLLKREGICVEAAR